VPFQPAGWAFVIWTLIYILLFAFVIYSFLPVGRRSARIQAVGPLFLVANIANIAWLFAWHWERFALSLVAIVVLLGSLAAIYGVLRRIDMPEGRGATVQRFLVGGTFSIYLAWISIATLANVEIWMDNGGWNGGPFGLRGWTVIFLIGGILVAAAFAFLARDAAYPLVFAWGYLAIANEQWNDSTLISILAGILAIGAAALTVMAALLAYDASRDPSSPPRSTGRT
jgi:tryptophan-rich sensory protein